MLTTRQKIVPQLWFDTEAVEAAEFYTSIFPDSRILSQTTLYNTPSPLPEGRTDIVNFEICGYEIGAISSGPLFEVTPAISFMINYDPAQMEDAVEALDAAWERLTEGGFVMMELGEYFFSRHYGWVRDKYGVSWQLILTDPDAEQRPPVIPALLFTQEVNGKAEEAVEHYLSCFPRAQKGAMYHYPPGTGNDLAGKLMFAEFQIEDNWICANDGGDMHAFGFNEAVSLLVRCESQEEIDLLWEGLSAVPEAEACGWLKDKYGVSWQIASADMDRMFAEGTQEQIDRVTEAFIPMKKLDVEALWAAYRGE